MFRNRVFVLSILALLAFSVAGPVLAAADQRTPYQAATESVTAYTITGNAGVGGAVLKYTDGTAKTTTANSSGIYSFIVPAGWSGTVTPSLTGYIFSPTSRSYTAVSADKTGQYYIATASTKTRTPTTSPTATPSPFTKLTPANGATGVKPNSATLSWKAYSPTPEKYRYCIDKIDNDICDSTGGYQSALGTSVTLSNLTGNTTYYWHVQAVRCGSCTPKKVTDSNNGIWWSFTTGATPTLTPTRTLTPTKTRTPTLTPTPHQLTITSSGAYDGWILESTETSGVGGTLNATAATFQLGDDSSNRQLVGILSFDTGAVLPAGANIQSAVIKIMQSGAPVGTNPFTVLSFLKVDIRQGTFGSTANLALEDFNASASANTVATFGTTPVSGWYSATLNATGRNNLNFSGLTQFRLHFGLDDNNNHVADYMRFVSGQSSTGRPQLFISYTLP